MDKQYIGSLYKKVGMDTSAEIVGKQMQVVELAYPELTCTQANSLILLLFCDVTDISELQWLISLAQDVFPGIGSQGVDKDVEILAAAILTRVIRGEKDFSSKICLTIETASFFGKRSCDVDPDIVTNARQFLLTHQTQIEELEELTEDSFYATEEQFSSADSAISSGNLQELWKPLKRLIADGYKDTQEAADNHAEKINEIVHHINAIEEQNKTQWFAISKWSKTSNSSFSSLSYGEAGVRAAFELGNIVRGTIGPVAAPALLNMALSDVLIKENNKTVSFPVLCTSSPINWRKSWIKLDAKNRLLRLTPVLAAILIANEASDEPDWLVRFQREIGVDTDFEISLLDFATQVFHEILVTRI